MKLTKTLLFSSVAVAGILGFSSNASAAEVDHVVTSSDTLTSISMKYFGSADYVNKIAEDNNIENPNLIYDGTTLVINTDTEATTEKVAINENQAQETTTNESTATDSSANYSGTTMYMESTAYSSDPADALGGGTVTATGQNLLENPMAVAVDPSVIPLGTHLYVEGYGEAYAVDTGSAIQGNIIDVHFPTAAQCEVWGRRQVKVTILN